MKFGYSARRLANSLASKINIMGVPTGALGNYRILFGLANSVLATGCQAQTIEPASTASQPPRLTSYNWRNVEINGGGFVSGLEFHPSARDVLYARTDIGGAYRWDEATKRWAPITDIFGPNDWNCLGVESIGLDPTDSNRVCLAVGTYTNSWAGNGAILRSTDRGRTWKRTNLPFKNGGNEDGRSMGERLAVDPGAPATVFFGTRRNGLWKSSDYGATWNQVKNFPVAPDAQGIGITFLKFHGRTLYAGTADKETSLLRSEDGGQSWTPVRGAPRGQMPHHGVFDAAGTMYLTYCNGPGPNGVTDGAVWQLNTRTGQWRDISPVKPGPDDAFGYAGLTLDARRPGVVMVSTLDRWAKHDDVFRSTDGGATWRGVRDKSTRDASAAPYLKWGKSEADIGHWIGDLEIDPFRSGRALYVTGATIWGSDNVDALDRNQTTQWDVRAGGIEEVSVSSLISPPEGAHLISGMRDIGGFRHDDLTVSPRGGMMENPLLNHHEGLDFAQNRPSLIVRTGIGKGGYSKDGGITWTPFAGAPPTSQAAGIVAVSADGSAWVWSGRDDAPYVTWDQGTTWIKANGLTPKATVVADRGANRTFYSVNGSTRTLLVSTDGGANFTPRQADLPEGAGNLFVTPSLAGDLWLGGATGLWRSTNGGVSFSRMPSVKSMEALGFGKAAPGANFHAIYLTGHIGDWNGVFRSDDGGATWLQLNTPDQQWGWIGKAVTGDPRVFGRVFVGTNGRGIIWGEPR